MKRLNSLRLMNVFVVFALFISFSETSNSMSKKKPEDPASAAAREVASDRDLASAYSEGKNLPKMLSYDELKALPPKRRTEYLYGIRSMLVQLASKRDKNVNMIVQQEQINKFDRILASVVPTATAQGGQSCAPVPSEGMFGYYYSCPCAGTMWAPKTGSCIADSIGGRGTGGRQGIFRDRGLPCPAGFRKAAMQGNSIYFTCIHEDAFNAASPERQRQWENHDVGAPELGVMVWNWNKSYREEILGGLNRSSTNPNLVYPVNGAGSGDTPQCRSSDGRISFVERVGTCAREITANENCGQGDEKIRSYQLQNGFLSSASQDVKYYCVPPASWCLLDSEHQTKLKNADASGNIVSRSEALAAARKISEFSEQQRSQIISSCLRERNVTATAGNGGGAQASGGGGVTQMISQMVQTGVRLMATTTSGTPCGQNFRNGRSCATREERDQRRQENEEGYRTQFDKCIFAGNISTFRDGQNRANQCQARRQIAGFPNLRCASNQVICNPIVFGVKQDGSAFCVAAASEATLECNEQSRANIGREAWANQNIGNLRDEWTNLADGVNNLCASNAARGYYCEECAIIMERLNSLRFIATGDNCSSPRTRTIEERAAGDSATRQ